MYDETGVNQTHTRHLLVSTIKLTVKLSSHVSQILNGMHQGDGFSATTLVKSSLLV